MRDLVYAQVATISVQPGHNPRRYFDDEEFAELCSSVKENGVLQPIILRRDGNQSFFLVAGERRWRACKEVFGDSHEIPCIVITDGDDAEAVSVIENTQRADMSPAEEAQAVVRLLKKNQGDKAEVARILGWTVNKVVRRAALAVCAQEVLDALTERKISLGHAELLASVSKEKQVEVLPKILEHGVSVADLRKRLQAYSLALETAPFDRTQCLNCRHNSANQASLFTETIDHGYCSNPPCFENKVKEHVEQVRADMTEQYPHVEVVEPGAEHFTSVSAETVGVDQFQSGCKGCANFGCAVHTAPGRAGEVEAPVCFDLTCNLEKKAAFVQSQNPEPVDGTDEEEEGDDCDGEQGCELSTSTSGSTGKSTGSCCTPSRPGVSTKLVEYSRKVWEKSLILYAKHYQLENLMVFSLVAISVRPDITILSKNLKAIAPDCDRNLSSLSSLFAQGEPKAVLALLASLIRSASRSNLSDLLRFHAVDLLDFWKPDQAFLDCLTKSEIESLLDETGYAAQKGDDLKKILSGKKGEIIAKLLEDSSFVDANVLPASLAIPA